MSPLPSWGRSPPAAVAAKPDGLEWLAGRGVGLRLPPDGPTTPGPTSCCTRTAALPEAPLRPQRRGVPAAHGARAPIAVAKKGTAVRPPWPALPHPSICLAAENRQRKVSSTRRNHLNPGASLRGQTAALGATPFPRSQRALAKIHGSRRFWQRPGGPEARCGGWWSSPAADRPCALPTRFCRCDRRHACR